MAKQIAQRHRILSSLRLPFGTFDFQVMDLMDYYGRSDSPRNWEAFYSKGISKKVLAAVITHTEKTDGIVLGILNTALANIEVGDGFDGDDLKLMPGSRGIPVRHFKFIRTSR